MLRQPLPNKGFIPDEEEGEEEVEGEGKGQGGGSGHKGDEKAGKGEGGEGGKAAANGDVEQAKVRRVVGGTGVCMWEGAVTVRGRGACGGC